MKVNCPNCKTIVEWNASAEFRPFCSKRCQLIDLGQWADEEHTISDSSLKQEDISKHIVSSIDNSVEAAPQKALSPSELEDIEAMLNDLSDDSFFKN